MPQVSNYDDLQPSSITNYIIACKDKSITKLGYTCEPKGISADYPIYIYNTGDTTPRAIEIGKTGMFEVISPKLENDEETFGITISRVDVPKDIKFILDYWEI